MFASHLIFLSVVSTVAADTLVASTPTEDVSTPTEELVAECDAASLLAMPPVSPVATQLGLLGQLEAITSTRTKDDEAFRVAVFSVNVGGYDKPPYNCNEAMACLKAMNIEVTCFLISDSLELAESAKEKTWIPIILPAAPGGHVKRESRVHKLIAEPMQNYTEYDFLVYHDGNCKPASNFANLFQAAIQATAVPGVDLVLFRHDRRSNVAAEARAVHYARLCLGKSIDGLMEHHSEEKFPDKLLLSDNNVIFRKWGGNRSDLLDQAMRLTIDTMTSFGCYRDQLSLNYALWKMNITRGILPFSAKPFLSNWHSDPNRSRGKATLGLLSTLAMRRP